MKDSKPPARRSYPDVYEKLIPIALGIIVAAIVVVLLIVFAGALLPAFGGTFSRFGIGGALYLSEFLGAILMFIGFVRAVTPMKVSDSTEATAA